MFSHISSFMAQHVDAAVFVFTTTICAVSALVLPLVG